MRTLAILSGIGVAGAGVLAFSALISQSPPEHAGSPASPGPRVEFLWSAPARNTAGLRPQNTPGLRPQIANNGSELQTDIAPLRHQQKHHEVAAEDRRPKHHQRHDEPADISASTVWEFSAPPASSPGGAPSREAATVQGRLRKNLSSELLKHFELFLYVSKAANGPLAQRMYVFQKSTHGDLDLLYDWPVSTGRERAEHNARGVELSSVTPTGYFKLDPQRFYRQRISSQWQHPMLFAMFFDWVQRGTPTGLAIHAATGNDIAALGTRASAGCIRLAPQAAGTLFTLIRSRYRGLTPRFAVNHRSGTMSDNGIILHDAKGRPELTAGYKALVVIENYGGENFVAATY